MGDADRAVAGEHQLDVAAAVPLEGGPVGVVFPAVELDQELRGGPGGVDLLLEDEDVGRRRRQLEVAAEGDETVLER